MMSTALIQLYHAAYADEVSGVRAALEAGADANFIDANGKTPLIQAVAFSIHAKCVKVLLEGGALVDHHGERTSTPLVLASGQARRAAVDTLISFGADVNLKDWHGDTALCNAACLGPAVGDRRAVIFALFRAGADPHKKYRDFTYELLKQNASSFALIDKFRKAGNFLNFARNHRRVLSSLVSKLSAKNATRPIPVDAAGHVVDFWTPPGGR